MGRVVGPSLLPTTLACNHFPVTKMLGLSMLPVQFRGPGLNGQRQHQESNLRFLDSWQEKVGEAIRRRTMG